MPKFSKLTLIIVCSMSLSACKEGNRDDSGVIQNTDYRKSTRATRLSDEFSMSCESKICPESTGVLFFSSLFKASTCTTWVAGELDGKTIVMTNKHCVENVRNCAEDLAFRFPGTNESAQCQKILKISEFQLEDRKGRSTQAPDYSIILLDRKLTAKSLPLSQEGLLARSPITIRKAWSTGNRSVEMKEHSCETGAPSVLARNYTTPTSPNISLIGCGVKSGVSGSPILNLKGEVAAIVSLGPKTDGTMSPSNQGTVTTDFNPKEFAVATNISCVEYSSLGLYQRKVGCDFPYVEDVVAELKPKIESAFNLSIVKFANSKVLEFNSQDQVGIFTWISRLDDGQRVKFDKHVRGKLRFELVPECVWNNVNPSKYMKENFYTYIEGNSGESGKWQLSDQVKIESPGWSFDEDVKFDKYGDVNVNFARGVKAATYELSPDEIANLKEDQTVLVVETVNGQSINLRLPLCKLQARGGILNNLPPTDELNGTEQDATKN